MMEFIQISGYHQKLNFMGNLVVHYEFCKLAPAKQRIQ